MPAASFLHSLFFRRSVLWCSCLSMFRKFLKPWRTSALPSCRPDVMITRCACQYNFAHSFPLTPECPGQLIHRSLCSRRLCMAVCQSGQPIPSPTLCSRFIESVRMMACVTCASRLEASHCIADTKHVSTWKYPAVKLKAELLHGLLDRVPLWFASKAKQTSGPAPCKSKSYIRPQTRQHLTVHTPDCLHT